MKRVAYRIIAAALALCSSEARAETLEPLTVNYDVKMRQGQEAAECHLLVSVWNFPKSPETIEFRLTFKVSKKVPQAIVGFIVSVGDVASDKGKPVWFTHAWLTSAAVYASGFNSPGQLYGGPDGDGGVYGGPTGGGEVSMSTNDSTTAAALASVVSAGDYVIEFTRQGAPTSRAYHIAQAPSIDVLNRYQKCTTDATRALTQ